jgi:hypothetical protein
MGLVFDKDKHLLGLQQGNCFGTHVKQKIQNTQVGDKSIFIAKDLGVFTNYSWLCGFRIDQMP